jgi:hypothetical protein
MGNLENYSFNNRRFQMKKFIVILLSILLTCTIFTSCKISKAVKNATKHSQTKKELKEATGNAAFGSAIRIDAIRRKRDSIIHAEKMSDDLYDSILLEKSILWLKDVDSISLNETTETEEK